MRPRWNNVETTLFQRRTLKLYRLCTTLQIRRRILFHFQCRINVIWTLIHNVETTLVRRWNVGWDDLIKAWRPPWLKSKSPELLFLGYTSYECLFTLVHLLLLLNPYRLYVHFQITPKIFKITWVNVTMRDLPLQMYVTQHWLFQGHLSLLEIPKSKELL